ncbi:hypothetical protein GALMADRAFT_144189 [Galerina marginata CBS 339.88]|uniref:Uncharacterized protein n=1 Tax=Galerina marginata (strain CBS 339.88) TaxID=685588 RepID=A0A067STU3_GALM3|nr:hypothetical protein GALMADRAFT_144189 [Galerina marginata CBS 339.88]
MLRDSFGVVVLTVPSNRLCSPVPNRMNYVLWVQDIVHTYHSVLGSRPRKIRGIDILSAEADNVSDNSMLLFLVDAQGNTWSRSARRSRHQQPEDRAEDVTLRTDQPTIPNLALTCSCRVTGASDTGFLSGNVAGGDAAVYSVEFQGVFGSDRNLFESFVGHVGRKAGLALQGGRCKSNEVFTPSAGNPTTNNNYCDR